MALHDHTRVQTRLRGLNPFIRQRGGGDNVEFKINDEKSPPLLQPLISLYNSLIAGFVNNKNNEKQLLIACIIFHVSWVTLLLA